MKARALCALTTVLALGLGSLSATPAFAGEVASFPDGGLRACVESSLASAGLPADFGVANLEKLTKLGCSGNGSAIISDLTGLEHLTGLVDVDLFNTSVTDLRPLVDLTGLTSLELYSTDLTDASALRNLAGLHSLRVCAPKVTDVGFVEPMTDLTWLDLWVGPTPDLNPVWARTNLTFLGLPVDKTADVSQLTRLDHLEYIQLHTFGEGLPTFTLPPSVAVLSLWSDGSLASIANLPIAPGVTHLEIWQAKKLQSLRGLEGLTGLTYATIQGTDLSDISALSALTGLEILALNSGSISDVSPLAGLTSLTSLSIRSNVITDLAALKGLTALTFLDLGHNNISDLTPLEGLSALEYLSGSSNPASDISPLSSLTALRRMSWWYLRATDLSALAGLPRLTDLDLANGSITTLGPTGGLAHLTKANFSGNRLTSIDALAGADKLTQLDLHNNWQLSDISPLASLPADANVSLWGDGIKDLSPLPDTVSFTAYRQYVTFPAVLAGSSTDLGIRDVTGAPLCPTFTTPGPTCAAGIVTYPPTASSYEGAVGSGTEVGPGLGMRFYQVAYTEWDFNTTHQPRITGVPAVGRTLTASTKPWIPVATTTDYQWRRAGRPIEGATSSTYVPTASDRGTQLSVCVTGHRYHYTDRTRCSSATDKVRSGQLSLTPTPTIAGSARTAAVLTADPGVWDDGVALRFQWQRNHASIKGATGSTYTLKASDVGDAIRVRVIGTRAGFGTIARYSRSITAHSAMLVSAVPTVTGEPRVGVALTADPGAWAPAPVKLSYQWYRGSRAISRATGTTYVLKSADLGAAITVRVTGTKPGYFTARRASVPTAAVAAA